MSPIRHVIASRLSGTRHEPVAWTVPVDKPAETELEWMWGAILWRPRFTRFMQACLERGAPTDFAGILNAAIAEGLDLRAARIADGSYIDVGTREEIAKLDEKYRT